MQTSPRDSWLFCFGRRVLWVKSYLPPPPECPVGLGNTAGVMGEMMVLLRVLFSDGDNNTLCTSNFIKEQTQRHTVRSHNNFCLSIKIP